MTMKNSTTYLAATALGFCLLSTGCSHSATSDNTNAAPVQTAVQNSQMPQEQKDVVQTQIGAAQQAAAAQAQALAAQKH